MLYTNHTRNRIHYLDPSTNDDDEKGEYVMAKLVNGNYSIVYF